jgi:hypothetical protein
MNLQILPGTARSPLSDINGGLIPNFGQYHEGRVFENRHFGWFKTNAFGGVAFPILFCHEHAVELMEALGHNTAWTGVVVSGEPVPDLVEKGTQTGGSRGPKISPRLVTLHDLEFSEGLFADMDYDFDLPDGVGSKRKVFLPSPPSFISSAWAVWYMSPAIAIRFRPLSTELSSKAGAWNLT